jgi:DNA processing protein
LIKQGAKLVQEWNDVVVELPPEDRRSLIARSRERICGGQMELDSAATSGEAAASVSGVARTLLGKLQVDAPAQIDVLLENVEEYSSSEIIAALFELEMLGLVKQLPGKNFVKVW